MGVSVSAAVRKLFRDDLAWFEGVDSGRQHAFEFVDGVLQEDSLCGVVEISTCRDEMARDDRGRKCPWCLTAAVTT